LRIAAELASAFQVIKQLVPFELHRVINQNDVKCI
jgi:hypothetical protein